jgi:hypothetical protein
MEATDNALERAAFAAVGRSFRGEIWENARRFRLVGKAYEAMPPEQNGYFDIRSARHLEGPLRALNDPEVRLVFIIGATQVMKSVAGDIWIPHLMEHDPSNTLVLFEDDPKAALYCQVRFMATIRKHPTLSARIESEVADRHQTTNTKIITPTMSLVAGGLNDGNVSSLSWRYIWVSEAWQHKSDGLLRKAIKRADRYPDTCKILIESQAGLAGEDLQVEASAAHPVPLTWACPCCGGRQTWEFSRLRPPEFTPRPVVNPLPGQLPLDLPPAPGSYAGMWFAPAERVVEGRSVMLSIDERARTARWECYHCGTLLPDTKNVRQQIMDSYQQDYQITKTEPAAAGERRTKTTPRAVCFFLPKESARNNSFEESARAYLTAKEQHAQGNELPLINWYLAERAVFYTPQLTQTRVAVITGTYDPTVEKIENESFRCLMVDCQKDKELSERAGKDMTGHFWFIADAVDKNGGTYQLARGYATSWQEWVAVQKRLKIPNRNVAVDGRHWTDTVKEMAAKHRTREKALDGSGKEVWATWKVMMGDDARGFRWDDGTWRSYRMPRTDLIDVRDETGKWIKVAVSTTFWSNFSITNQLDMLKRGLPGKPAFVSLPERSEHLSETTIAKEVGDFTYYNQMNGQILGVERGKPKWVDLHKQQHYADCAKMGVVLKAMKGLIGHVAEKEEAGQEAP